MNDSAQHHDFLTFGLSVSLLWHISLIFIIVPVLSSAVFTVPRSSTYFLGALLKDQDLAVLRQDKNEEQPARKASLLDDKSSKALYFNRPFQQVYKPKVPLKAVPMARDDIKVMLPAGLLAEPLGRDIAFGFSDFSRYVANVDFSDLKRMASREDLFGAVVFKITLYNNGEVRSIKKIMGCGDPILDFYVMLKLKNARFLAVPDEEGAVVDVRFRIK